MKLATDNKNGLSWGIRLEDYLDGEIHLIAANSTTAHKIKTLMIFCPTGLVRTVEGAEGALRDKGYDPYEHGNKFSKDGELVVE